MNRLADHMRKYIKPISLILLAALSTTDTLLAETGCHRFQTSALTARKLVTRDVVSVPLDFDGDGISDTVTSFDKGSKTVFNLIASSTGLRSSTEIIRGTPVPADYDGDGKADIAVASSNGRTIVFTIILSSTGETVTRSLGSKSASLISGCYFNSAEKASLAVFDSGRLKAIDLNSTSKRTIIYSKFSRVSPVGCGDSTGDGIDELIVSGGKTSSSDNHISTVSCVNDFVDYGAQGAGADYFIFNKASYEIPSVGRTRPASNSNLLVRLAPLYDVGRFPALTIPSNASFIVGNFGKSVPGLQWLNPKNGVITRQLFLKGSPKENVATVGRAEKLVKGQQVIGNDEL